MKGFLGHWLPPLAWMGIIYYLSAQPDLPGAPSPWLDTLIKKTAHALAYGVLACLYRRALGPHVPSSSGLWVVSAGLAILYAVSDEVHQAFVPGRNGRLSDVAIDATGAVCAMLLDRRWEQRRLPARCPPPDQPPAAR